MKIYKAESAVADKMINQKSVAYIADVDLIDKSDMPERAVSSTENINFDTPQTSDLYYTRSVFVSTVWNLNGDVFTPEETWAARKTPIDKPTNIEHDLDNKIGHITSQWAIDAEGNLIDDTLAADEVPALFHVCNGAVIYTYWDKNQEKIDAFLEELSDGQWSVSMESLFSDFDYALRKGDDYHIIKRDSTSAFLTKKLRAYGGDGIHDGYEVGRVLKDIIFSGKGYVRKPANPDSVIFSNDKISNFSFASAKKDEFFGVYNNRTIVQKTENITMSAELLEKQVADLQSQLAEAKKESTQAKTELAEAGVKTLKSTIAQLEAELTEAKATVDELDKAKSCMCQQFDALKAEKEGLEAKYQELLDKQTMAERVEAFVAKNYSKDEAVAKAKTTASFSKENFDIIIAMIPDKSKPEAKAEVTAPASFTTEEETADATETEVETEKVPSKATASVEVHENTKEDKMQATTAAVSNYFSKVLNVKKKENK